MEEEQAEGCDHGGRGDFSLNDQQPVDYRDGSVVKAMQAARVRTPELASLEST